MEEDSISSVKWMTRLVISQFKPDRERGEENANETERSYCSSHGITRCMKAKGKVGQTMEGQPETHLQPDLKQVSANELLVDEMVRGTKAVSTKGSLALGKAKIVWLNKGPMVPDSAETEVMQRTKYNHGQVSEQEQVLTMFSKLQSMGMNQAKCPLVRLQKRDPSVTLCMN